MKAIRRFTVRIILPEPLAPLRGLILNLRWSWHAPTADLFASIDPAAWAASNGDPVATFSALPPDRIAALATDPGFLGRLHEAEQDLRDYMSGPHWYAEARLAGAGPAAVAYFSPEYGITAALPQYSGGLGILAGDHLKSASDLGVPLIGVGLLYRHGYFTQSLSADGWQAERYPSDDPNGQSLELLRDAEGLPVHVAVSLTAGRQLAAQVWVAQVGRIPLLLLDSYVEENEPDLHEVTDRLYGGGSEHRLRQELLLGIGGMRAVRAFCALTGHPSPEVFHTNEGHAGFLGLERIREYAERGLSFDEAIEVCRAGTVFTTHTPVSAGIDRFPRQLVRQQFDDDPLLPVDQVLALGAETYPGGDPDVFNMAVMGMRLARRVNGVSLLHGQVSRKMFAGLWPGFDTREVPIGSITNGVHMPTWVAPEIGSLAGAPGGWDWDRAAAAPAAEIWAARHVLRSRLVAETRRRLRASWRQRGASEAELTWIDDVLDDHVLTIGFARRVPSYKRLTLMLNDPATLSQLLNDPAQPVQIVVAGKAHPADDGGKALIQQMVQFADAPDVRRRIVFLPDYDIAMARTLVQGCDVWLNNPLRPLEACGTSGMKAALNGALNLSVRDGWWDEWYDGGNGWEIPSADGVADVGAAGRARGPGPVRDARQVGGAAVLRTRRGRHPAGLGGADPARAALTRAEGPGRADGPRVRDRAVRARRGLLPGADRRRRVRARPGAGRLEEAGDRGLAGGADRARGVRGHRVAGPAPRFGAGRARLGGPGRADPGRRGRRGGVRAAGRGGRDRAARLRHADRRSLRHRRDRDRRDRDRRDRRTAGTGTAGTGTAEAADTTVRYSGEVPLDRPGPFGYTVRVLPNHPLLDSRAELGLVTYPQAPAGMTNGDLR